MVVTYIVLYSYVIGWALTSVGLALSARQASRLFAALAGAVWPLLVLGAAQMAIVVMIAGRSDRPTAGHSLEYSDDELHVLIDEWRIEFEQRR